MGERRSALESAVWSKVSAPADAVARATHAFVYDSARENCLVFGGRAVDDHGFSFEDTGLWMGNTWVPVATRYARRGYVTGAFDAQRSSTVVYGGTDGPSHFADTWEFDGSRWNQRIAVSAPGNRSANGLAFDARRGVTVLFGGFDGRWKDDLWEWDGNTWTQRCNTPPCSQAPRPGPRSRAVFVYDDARGVTLLFGGSGDDTAYDDTWTWDGEQWAQLSPSESPMTRDLAAATYDPISKRVLMFGGLAPGLQELNDFWAFDGAEWSSISQTSTPFARHGAGMAWNAKRKHGVLFGGSSSEQATDAWEFRLFGTPCTTRDDCHAGPCIAGSCWAREPPSGSGGAESGGGNAATGGSGASDANGGSGGSTTIENGGAAGSTQGGASGAAQGGASGAAQGGASGAAQGGVSGAAQGGAPSDGAGAPDALVAGATAAEGPRPAGASGAPSRAPARSFYSCAFSPRPGAARWPLMLVLAWLLVTGRGPRARYGAARRIAGR